jgi:hypothetical protein
MQQAKDLLHQRQPDQPAKALITKIVDRMRISVTHIDFLLICYQFKGFRPELNVQIIGQKIAKPEIMIAGDMHNAAASLSDLIELDQKRKILFDDGVFPVKPEIKDISIQDQKVVFVLGLLQETQDQGVVLFVLSIEFAVFAMQV